MQRSPSSVDMDTDLEKGMVSSEISSNTAPSLADDKEHRRLSCCDDHTCSYHYTHGLCKATCLALIIVSLLFAVLAALILRQNPAPAAAAEEAANKLPNTSAVVWKVSLLSCSYLYFWILALSRSMGATSAFIRVSYGALLAFAAGVLAGPHVGVTLAHLNTAWAAGLFGYALAEHRVHTGTERAAAQAAALTPATPSENDKIGCCYTAFVSSLVTLLLAAGVAAWLVLGPALGDETGPFVVVGLSLVVWVVLYFWAMFADAFLLQKALVSMDFMMRVYVYFMVFFFPSLLCLVLGTWAWAYFFTLEMMAMAAFFGYILGVNARRKEILAWEGEEQPVVLDGEPEPDDNDVGKKQAPMDLKMNGHLPVIGAAPSD